MDLNGLKVTIFVEEGLAVYVVSRDMVLRDIDSANLVLRAVLSLICPIRCPQGIHIWHVYV